jgi:hypothetical protein
VVCSNFVNQVAFPEKDFLALFVPILSEKAKGETADLVIAALKTKAF